MNPEKRADEEPTFGEQLLGMQGFSAARAARYRAEMAALLIHRLPASDRWVMGVAGVVLGATLLLGGIGIACAKAHPESEELDAARWTVAVTCMVAGLLLGGWLLRMAIQGGYARRLGDGIGLAITAALCGGWGAAFVQGAWGTSDGDLRLKLLGTAALLFALLAGCLVVALLQRMHRQTQEKLLRIEYHLTELMERNSG